ncbi:ABC transporter ATP-binding protein [Pigmentiphaga soli]|uniref:ABC transporter ATP-binding protein n=1 Tax=Pigmentiphaga soli TaxID=1007095 RepID=A0ABP8HM30_9BURK
MSEEPDRRVVLRARGLAAGYPGACAAVFEGIDLDLRAGEIVAVLGASGVGKSSLLRVLAGLQPFARGTIEMDGAPLAGVHPRVAVAFQDASLLPWLTLERNVAYGLNFSRQPASGPDERRRRVDRAIAEVGLDHARHLRPAQLSGGMAQRAALARCLARQPSVLLLDEPFGALDEVTRAGMQQLLIKVVADFRAATLLITHDIDEALAVADRVLLLGGSPGRLAAQWPVTLPQPRENCLHELGALRVEVLTRLRDALRQAQAPAAGPVSLPV